MDKNIDKSMSAVTQLLKGDDNMSTKNKMSAVTQELLGGITMNTSELRNNLRAKTKETLVKEMLHSGVLAHRDDVKDVVKYYINKYNKESLIDIFVGESLKPSDLEVNTIVKKGQGDVQMKQNQRSISKEIYSLRRINSPEENVRFLNDMIYQTGVGSIDSKEVVTVISVDKTSDKASKVITSSEKQVMQNSHLTRVLAKYNAPVNTVVTHNGKTSEVYLQDGIIFIDIVDDKKVISEFEKHFVNRGTNGEVGIIQGRNNFGILFKTKNGYISPVIDPRTGKNISLTKDKFDRLGGKDYVFLTSSPSGIKKQQFTVIRADLDRESIIMEMTYNGLKTYLEEAHSRVTLVKKFTGRESQAMPSSFAFGHVKNVAIFNGKFLDSAADGQSFISADSILESYRDMGVLARRSAILGTTVQHRIANNKSHAVVSNPVMLNRVAYNIGLKEASEVVIVSYKDDQFIGDFSQESLIIVTTNHSLVKAYNSLEDKSKENVLQLLESINLDLVTDMNAIKLDYELDAPAKHNILAASSGRIGGTVSTQSLEKAFVHRPKESMEIVGELLEDSLDHIIEEIKSYDESDSEVSIKELEGDKLYLEGVINKLAPIARENDVALYKSTIQNSAKRFNKILSKTKFSTETVNLALNADVSKFFIGEDILSYNEIYSPVLSKMNVTKAVMFKYPSMGIREFLVVNAVSKEELLDRIENKVSNKEDKVAYMDYISNMGNGSAMVSSNETLKNHLAGLDFDWDAGSFVFNPGIVALYDDIQTKDGIHMVEIAHEKSEDKGEKVIADHIVRAEIFFMQILNKDLNVGRVTNINSTIISALSALKYSEDNLELVQTILNSAMSLDDSFDPKHNKYVGLKYTTKEIDGIDFKVYHVSQEEVNRLDAQFKEIDFFTVDRNTAINILEDLNMVARFYQESVIDQDKDLNKVVHIISMYRNIETVAKSSLLLDNTVVYDWRTNSVKLDTDSDDNKLIVESPLSELFFDIFNNKVDELNELAKGSDRIQLSLLIRNQLAFEYSQLDDKYKLAIEKIVSQYKEVNMERIKELSLVTEEFELDAIDERYNRLYRAISNNLYEVIRQSGMSSHQAAKVVLHVSIGGDNSNAFARVIAPELYILGFMDIQREYGEVQEYAYERIWNKADYILEGQRPVLKDGNCEDHGFTTRSTYSGQVEVVSNDRVAVPIIDLLEDKIFNRTDNGERFLSVAPLSSRDDQRAAHIDFIEKTISQLMKSERDLSLTGHILSVENEPLCLAEIFRRDSLKAEELFNSNVITPLEVYSATVKRNRRQLPVVFLIAKATVNEDELITEDEVELEVVDSFEDLLKEDQLTDEGLEMYHEEAEKFAENDAEELIIVDDKYLDYGEDALTVDEAKAIGDKINELRNKKADLIKMRNNFDTVIKTSKDQAKVQLAKESKASVDELIDSIDKEIDSLKEIERLLGM